MNLPLRNRVALDRVHATDPVRASLREFDPSRWDSWEFWALLEMGDMRLVSRELPDWVSQ